MYPFKKIETTIEYSSFINIILYNTMIECPKTKYYKGCKCGDHHVCETPTACPHATSSMSADECGCPKICRKFPCYCARKRTPEYESKMAERVKRKSSKPKESDIFLDHIPFKDTKLFCSSRNCITFATHKLEMPNTETNIMYCHKHYNDLLKTRLDITPLVCTKCHFPNNIFYAKVRIGRIDHSSIVCDKCKM